MKEFAHIEQSITLTPVREVQIIYSRLPITEYAQITSSQNAYDVFKACFDLTRIDYKEFFHIILLNKANRVLGTARISEGSTSSTIVNTVEIFQLALRTNATGIILAHNHPSGKCKPSDSDKLLTKKIKQGCELLDIQLIDHLILTQEDFFSFVDAGEL